MFFLSKVLLSICSTCSDMGNLHKCAINKLFGPLKFHNFQKLTIIK